jgi:hypothetical protein
MDDGTAALKASSPSRSDIQDKEAPVEDVVYSREVVPAIFEAMVELELIQPTQKRRFKPI